MKINFRVIGQKIERVKQTKFWYISRQTPEIFKFQISQVQSKVRISSGLLAKLKYYLKSDLLRTVYFAIFDSILRYGIQVQVQNRNQAIKDIEKIQEKTSRIFNFKWKNDPVNLLFKNSETMKMKDILTFNNCLFVYDQINEDMPSNFEDFFTTSENKHPCNTIIKTLSNSTTYGLNCVRHRAASEWNEINKNCQYYRLEQPYFQT